MEQGDLLLAGVLMLSVVPLVALESVSTVRGHFGQRFWNLPLDDKLDHLVSYRREWWWMGGTWVAILAAVTAGMAALAGLLGAAGEPALAWASFGAFVIGSAAWLGGLFVQTAVVWWAAERRHETGETPEALAPFWSLAYFAEMSSIVISNLAFVGFGVAVLLTSVPAAWAGWTAIVAGALLAVVVVLTRFGFPHMVLLVPVVLGIALVLETV